MISQLMCMMEELLHGLRICGAATEAVHFLCCSVYMSSSCDWLL